MMVDIPKEVYNGEYLDKGLLSQYTMTEPIPTVQKGI